MPGTDVKRLVDRLAVYLVADPAHSVMPIVDVVAQSLAGGVTCVQLRAKTLSDRNVLSLALQMGHLCRQSGALFLINDRIDLALACGADGAHLGVDDLPLEYARNIAGTEFIIGYSPETDEQAVTARSRGADYLGVGPVYGTSSKPDAGDAVGLETVRRRVALAGIPVIGIGGVSTANAAAVIEAGAVGVAVVSAILGSSDPHTAATSIADSVQVARSVP